MKEDAKRQMEEITIAQIKEALKKGSPDKFDKMIISDGQTIKRGNYVIAKLKFDKVEREVELIKFPLYSSIKDNFTEIEGGEAKFGVKSPINSNKMFDTLRSNYQITGEGCGVGKVMNVEVRNTLNVPITNVMVVITGLVPIAKVKEK